MDRKQIQKKMQKKNRDHRQHRQMILIGSLFVAVCCLFGGILARYIHQSVTEKSQITADSFYFTANLLGDTTMVPQEGAEQESYAFGEASTEGSWDLYGASQHEIKVIVQNYYDAFRVTKEEIAYTGSVTVTDADGNEIKKASPEAEGSGTPYPVWKQGDQIFSNGTLPAGENGKQETTLTLQIPSYTEWNYTDGTVVTAKLTSTVPYRKTLTLKFILYATDTTLKYQVVDSVGSPYAELILMTNVDEAAGVKPTLQWSDDLSIDNTNPLTFTYDKDSGAFTQQNGMENRNMQISQSLQAGRSESIYFFKTDTTKDYSKEETIVNPGGENNYVVLIGK